MEVRNLKAIMLSACMGLPAAAPNAQAAVDPEQLMQAYEKLLQRVEQLEITNKKLETALGQVTGAQATGDQVAEVSERVEDMESQIKTLKQPGKVEQALDGVSVGASLTMVGQSAMSGSATGKDDNQLNYRADIEVEIPGTAWASWQAFPTANSSCTFAPARALA